MSPGGQHKATSRGIGLMIMQSRMLCRAGKACREGDRDGATALGSKAAGGGGVERHSVSGGMLKEAPLSIARFLRDAEEHKE